MTPQYSLGRRPLPPHPPLPSTYPVHRRETFANSMTMELTWSLDYCLACDKQTAGETYCSQACRLSDLESSSSWSGPTSPATAGSSPSCASNDTKRGSGFYLSPAINFANYKASDTSSSVVSDQTQPWLSYFTSTPSNRASSARALTPSSSHSSLNSTRSDSSQSSLLSEQARTELRDYSNAFDDTRNWRRRMTWS